MQVVPTKGKADASANDNTSGIIAIPASGARTNYAKLPLIGGRIPKTFIPFLYFEPSLASTTTPE